MTQRTRILIGVAVLIMMVVVLVGIDLLQRVSRRPQDLAQGEPTVVAGSIPIRLEGRLVGSFGPADLDVLEMVSFVEAEEGKTEEGWLLRDALLLHIDEQELNPEMVVAVSSNSRDKAAELTWAEVDDPANWVMFDLSSRGTLKLVSVLEKLDTRDEWVQDVDGIELSSP